MIALAIVFWVLQTPAASFLYQTFPLLVFALRRALRRAGAAHVAGDGGRGTDRAWTTPRDRSAPAGCGGCATVDLPLMRPGLAAGGGLVLLSTMKELPATLFLAPIGFETLATRIWTATEDGFLAWPARRRSCWCWRRVCSRGC